jgi:sRNA-binding protein
VGPNAALPPRPAAGAKRDENYRAGYFRRQQAAEFSYQASLTAGAPRIGLDGLPAGTVTEAEAEHAVAFLQAKDELQADIASQARQASGPRAPRSA